MKIDESPYYFANQAALAKLKQPGANGLNTVGGDLSLDDFDLSFLDMLTNMTPDGQTTQPVLKAGVTKIEKKKDTPSASKTTDAVSATETATAVDKPVKHHDEWDADSISKFSKDFTLLKADMTAQDLQYMKQGVIPYLPIITGASPSETVFPTGDGGSISYKGFDVSPKLSELIEKGFKTGRPIRVELDNNSAVVLRIREGRVSAEFVSSDKGLAMAMQQDLNDFRNKMAMKNLPIGTLESKFQQQTPQGQQDSRQPRDSETDADS